MKNKPNSKFGYKINENKIAVAKFKATAFIYVNDLGRPVLEKSRF